MFDVKDFDIRRITKKNITIFPVRILKLFTMLVNHYFLMKKHTDEKAEWFV